LQLEVLCNEKIKLLSAERADQGQAQLQVDLLGGLANRWADILPRWTFPVLCTQVPSDGVLLWDLRMRNKYIPLQARVQFLIVSWKC
jgi:hypothetical protein